jgi:hypothetical protein
MTKTQLKTQYYTRIRAWKAANVVKKHKRFPTDDMAEAVAIAELGLAVGRSHVQTSARLGLSNSTLWNWSLTAPKASEPTAGALPVEITMPGGIKISGLTPAQATKMLKDLG